MDKAQMLMFGLGLSLVILMATAFYIGGYYACHNGGGELQGFMCVDYYDAGVCNYLGQDYVTITENITWLS